MKNNPAVPALLGVSFLFAGFAALRNEVIE